MDKQKDFCISSCRSLFYFQAAARADGAGRVLFFRSNGFALRAGAPAAWGRFFLSVKWLCAPRGPEVGRGESKHPSLPLARAERKPLDRKKKPAPRHQRENQLKEKTSPALWPARSAKPFDQKKKPAPRHQRENQLKEKTSPALWPARSALP
ncbi:MAG: hypothetical protein U0N26_07285, partial [Faecalibacterium prausnitzii]